MLADRDRIGGLGLAFLLAAGMIEVGVLKLPRVLAAKFGRDLWLLPPLLLVTSLISLAVFCWLGRRFPRETVFEYAPRLVGKIGGHILSLTLVLFWILCGENGAGVFRFHTDVFSPPDAPGSGPDCNASGDGLPSADGS